MELLEMAEAGVVDGYQGPKRKTKHGPGQPEEEQQT
jgi:hypothetical protein